jgi:hypothetical protein
MNATAIEHALLNERCAGRVQPSRARPSVNSDDDLHDSRAGGRAPITTSESYASTPITTPEANPRRASRHTTSPTSTLTAALACGSKRVTTRVTEHEPRRLSRYAVSALALWVSACATVPARPVDTAADCKARFEARGVTEVRPSPGDELVWREERFDVELPVDSWSADFFIGGANLENFLPGAGRVPGVDHNEDLTPSTFPVVGSKRVVCLRDGASALEEVLESTPRGLRYLVSNYSSPGTEPILYGLGEFRFEPLAAQRTRVTWRYSFRLRTDTFPGSLGTLGRALFRANFLDGDYAEFMRAGVDAMRAWPRRAHPTGPVNL